MAKKAGMDFVTLTDHETIEGPDPGPPPDFFVGEEVAAYLPEEDGYVDVLVYGLDHEVHREAQGRRANAHELVGYLREAGVVHVLAHPIYAMPGPLDRRTVEKRLVMFGLWELINGSRPAQQNRLAREIAEGVGRIELRQMAMRQGLPVPPHHRISGTGGSDDHGGIYGGVTHTVLPRVESTKEVLAAIAAGGAPRQGKTGRSPRWSTPASGWPAGHRRRRDGAPSECCAGSPSIRRSMALPRDPSGTRDGVTQERAAPFAAQGDQDQGRADQALREPPLGLCG